MEGRKDKQNIVMPELPDEMIAHLGSFFLLRERVLARRVCKQWNACVPPVSHLYILGSPILVGSFEDDDPALQRITIDWKSISKENVDESFSAIPQNGFVIFPTYQDAHLYAHRFYTKNEDPNFNAGVNGLGYCKNTFLTERRDRFTLDLYHPAIFEVAYKWDRAKPITWQSFEFLNLGPQKKSAQLSAIRAPNCKDNLEVLRAKLEVEYIFSMPTELKTLYDSTLAVEKEVDRPDTHEQITAPAPSYRCIMM